jgi:hypothetical protein
VRRDGLRDAVELDQHGAPVQAASQSFAGSPREEPGAGGLERRAGASQAAAAGSLTER